MNHLWLRNGIWRGTRRLGAGVQRNDLHRTWHCKGLPFRPSFLRSPIEFTALAGPLQADPFFCAVHGGRFVVGIVFKQQGPLFPLSAGEDAFLFCDCHRKCRRNYVKLSNIVLEMSPRLLEVRISTLLLKTDLLSGFMGNRLGGNVCAPRGTCRRYI